MYLFRAHRYAVWHRLTNRIFYKVDQWKNTNEKKKKKKKKKKKIKKKKKKQ